MSLAVRSLCRAAVTESVGTGLKSRKKNWGPKIKITHIFTYVTSSFPAVWVQNLQQKADLLKLKTLWGKETLHVLIYICWEEWKFLLSGLNCCYKLMGYSELSLRSASIVTKLLPCPPSLVISICLNGTPNFSYSSYLIWVTRVSSYNIKS
jgi:hypothetical protein